MTLLAATGFAAQNISDRGRAMVAAEASNLVAYIDQRRAERNALFGVVPPTADGVAEAQRAREAIVARE